MIEVFSLSRKFRPLESRVRQTAWQTLRFLRKKGLVSIWLLPDSRMRALNRRFRSKYTPANVLSFPHPRGFAHPEVSRKDKVLGEIYLAPDYLKKRGENIDLMVIHGLLHLLGYDHKTKSDTMRMERKEEKLFRKVISKQ